MHHCSVTDRGEPVAVIIGYKQFQALIAALGYKEEINQKSLAGLILSAGDSDASNEKVKRLFGKSIRRSASHFKRAIHHLA